MTVTTVRDVLQHVEALWPAYGAEDWDVVGLVTGSPDAAVKRVLFVVDVTDATVSEAVDGGYDLIIAHHPFLLRGVNSLAEDRVKGDAIARLIRSGCALVSVHTNGDRVETGTSATLARALDIDVQSPIAPHPLGGGLGIVGSLRETLTLGEFAQRIASVLPATATGVRVSGDFTQSVTVVSLCAGAGDSLLGHPSVSSTDVYVTSDLRHHPATDFREEARLSRDTALIDISHWAAEWLWLDVAASQLATNLPHLHIAVSDINTDPWTFTVTQ